LRGYQLAWQVGGLERRGCGKVDRWMRWNSVPFGPGHGGHTSR
jgi:hypothetical protein